MEKRIITISREFGSGGRTIGKLVAEQLGIQWCYDAELIRKLAVESGFDESYIKEAGEYTPGGFLASAFTDRSFERGPALEAAIPDHPGAGRKRALRHRRTLRRFYPAGPHRLPEGLCPRGHEVPG